MKVAIVGTRGITANISEFIPSNVSSIICSSDSDMAVIANNYATKHNVPIELIKPLYPSLKRGDALLKNRIIVEESDFLIAVWDGESVGTKHTIKYAEFLSIPVKVVLSKKETTSSDS